MTINSAFSAAYDTATRQGQHETALAIKALREQVTPLLAEALEAAWREGYGTSHAVMSEAWDESETKAELE